jgi:hypothetical protein
VVTREFSRNEEHSWWKFWKKDYSVEHVKIMYNQDVVSEILQMVRVYKTPEAQRNFMLKDRLVSSIDVLADQVGFL